MLEICRFGAFAFVGRAGLSGEPLLTSRSPYTPVAVGNSPADGNYLYRG